MKVPRTWNGGPKGPKNIGDMRKVMKEKIRNKKGKTLISAKFTKDHIFCGHKGGPEALAIKLANLRELPLSTYLISTLDMSANAEVLNWIEKIPNKKLKPTGTTWTIDTQ